MLKTKRWKFALVAGFTALAIYFLYPPQEKINLGLDLQGGMHIVLRVDTSELPKDAKKDAAERAVEVIRNRIDQFGVKEPQIQIQGKDRIIVQLPGISDRERALDLIGKTALLEFKLVNSDQEAISKALSGEDVEGYELKYSGKEALLVEKKASLTGDTLVDATVKFDSSRFNEPTVSLLFNSQGAKKFAKITRDNVGNRLAIVLDGVVQSAPNINEPIPSGQAQISGRFTIDEANDLAIVLRAGALPAPIHIEEERTVGPSLGKDSVTQGIRATIIGGILVMVFMAVYYLLCGLIANVALILNLILILGALAYFKAALTLPGIAGIILTIGMAVDANVLIFERIREELRVGKTIKAALNQGYKKAFLTILDANLTTLITALVLFQFGTGPIRGFAVTLSVGILCSMFSALIFSRMVMEFLTSVIKVKTFKMLSLIKAKTNIKFIDKRKIAYILSALLIIVGLFAFISRGEENFGIDFTGGTLQQFKFDKKVSLDKLRDVMKGLGMGDVPIQQLGKENEVLIRTSGDADIVSAFKEKIPEDTFEIQRIEKVGPAVGKELREKAFLSLFYAMLGICIYITVRFEFKFAIAAIIALLHDVLITIGFFGLTAREISLPVIAALLTIVGYSLNDTIVVFDRIREDLRLMRKADYKTIINTSINQTLGRTLLTSLTTLLVVLSLYFLGGEVIRDFAFALIVGVVIGTYSSIFVASPILIDWSAKLKRS